MLLLGNLASPLSLTSFHHWLFWLWFCLCLLASPPRASLCGNLLLRGSPQAPPILLLSVAPLPDHLFAVSARSPQHCNLQQRGLLFAKSDFTPSGPGRLLASAVRWWSPTPLCGTPGCVHPLSEGFSSRPQATARFSGSSNTAGRSSILVSLCRLTFLTEICCFMCCAFHTLPHEPLLSLSHAASLHVVRGHSHAFEFCEI